MEQRDEDGRHDCGLSENACNLISARRGVGTLFAHHHDRDTWGLDVVQTEFYLPQIYLAIFLIGMPGQYLFGVTHPEQYVPFRQQVCAANARIACGDLYFLRIRVSSPNASTRTADYRATS